MTNFQTGILISVAKIHGTKAEKKITAETLTTPTTNFVLIAALATNNDGKTFLQLKLLKLLRAILDLVLGKYK